MKGAVLLSSLFDSFVLFILTPDLFVFDSQKSEKFEFFLFN